MSQTAMFSGMYEEVRDYAELLDKVLVEVKGGISQPQDEKRKKLSQFLTELGSLHPRNLAVRLISRLLRSEGHVTPQELASIGARLRAPEPSPIDPVMISQLEELARSLEQEQTVAMARMRGKEL